MNRTSLKRICLPSLFSIAVIALALNLPGTCYGTCDGFEIGIDVSPNIVNIESKGEAHPVRVFTNASYSNVALETVDLYITHEAIEEEYLIPSWKTRDSWGHLIVKFYLDELDTLVENNSLTIDGENTLTVCGETKGGASFWGEGIIFIIDKQGF